MSDNFDELTEARKEYLLLRFRERIMREEYSEGTPIEPVPEPPPPIQYPPVPKSQTLIPLEHLPGLCLGVLMIGISIGLWLSEYEWKDN
jgi:hypothetical protein